METPDRFFQLASATPHAGHHCKHINFTHLTSNVTTSHDKSRHLSVARILEAYSPKVILSLIRSPKMSEPASAENPTEDEAATKANPTASTQPPQEIEPVYVNARRGGPLERRVKWISGPQYYPGYGDGKAAQDFSAPVLPDEFPPIAAQNRKFYNADFARKRLESSLEFEKSIVLEKGICGLCRGIFDDEEGKKGFKVFPYHEDIFRVVVSARVGCGVCRLFLQSVKE
jgi:hypothetical protein